jgi:rhomboid protease GluP
MRIPEGWRSSWRQFPGTWGLMAINCGVFFLLEGVIYGLLGLGWLVQLVADPDWLDVGGPMMRVAMAFENGSLMPIEVLWRGQWWRCWTAMFLHAGLFHLFSNMVALWILGRLVERYLGTWRYLAAYFLMGVGSMVGVTLVALRQGNLLQTTVGASGGIMGLLGLLAMLCAWDWWRWKTPIAGRRLRSLVLIMVMQVAFDQVVPMVSVSGHLSGLVLGLVLGGLLGLRGVRVRSV